MQPAAINSEEFRGPLEHCVLPKLTAVDLSRLPCASRTLRDILADVPSTLWTSAATAVLPQSLTACNTQGQALELLSKYAAAQRHLCQAQGGTETHEIDGDFFDMSFSPDRNILLCWSCSRSKIHPFQIELKAYFLHTKIEAELSMPAGDGDFQVALLANGQQARFVHHSIQSPPTPIPAQHVP